MIIFEIHNATLHFHSTFSQNLLMHIKAFLKKIAENSFPERFNSPTTKKQRPPLTRIQRKIYQNSSSIGRDSFVKKDKDNESTIKYIEIHSPGIKERMIKEKRTSISPDKSKNKIFREQIQERLTLLMSQRKELIVTRTSRKSSCKSIGYSSQKDPRTERPQREIPDFVKNIMKPCSIASVRLAKRPLSSQATAPIKIQPKIYCKKLISPRQKQPLRTSTSKWNISIKMKTPGLKRQQKTQSVPQLALKGWHQQNRQDEHSILMIF